MCISQRRRLDRRPWGRLRVLRQSRRRERLGWLLPRLAGMVAARGCEGCWGRGASSRGSSSRAAGGSWDIGSPSIGWLHRGLKIRPPGRCGRIVTPGPDCPAPHNLRVAKPWKCRLRLHDWDDRENPEIQFSSTNDDPRYDKKQVAAFIDAARIRLAAMESTDRPAGPLVSGAILADWAEWAEWADSTRFSIRRLRVGRSHTAEVDAFREAIRDTFLGVSRSPLPWHAARGKRFTTTRPGYDVEQVDAFLDKAVPRLAAMRATDKAAT